MFWTECADPIRALFPWLLPDSLTPGGQVKLLFETVISAFKVVNTLFLCVGCVLLFFGNVG